MYCVKKKPSNLECTAQRDSRCNTIIDEMERRNLFETIRHDPKLGKLYDAVDYGNLEILLPKVDS